MSDPTRLRDELVGGLAGQLLDAGAAYRSSDAMRAKTMAALGIAGGAALSAGAASAGTASWLAKLGTAKAWLGISAIGVVAGLPLGYVALHHGAGRSPLASFAAGLAPQATSPSQPDQGTQGPSAETSGAHGEDLEARREGATSPDEGPVRLEGKNGGSRIALSGELAALDAIGSKLRGGDARGALPLLDAYDRTYPRGHMRLEAEVLRIDALAKSGQSDAAKRRAEAFLRRHPDSVLAPRVRAYTAP